jgi:hypothetical protein
VLLDLLSQPSLNADWRQSRDEGLINCMLALNDKRVNVGVQTFVQSSYKLGYTSLYMLNQGTFYGIFAQKLGG